MSNSISNISESSILENDEEAIYCDSEIKTILNSELNNFDDNIHGWERIRQCVIPRLERQRAFSDADLEIEDNPEIWRSLENISLEDTNKNSETKEIIINIEDNKNNKNN